MRDEPPASLALGLFDNKAGEEYFFVVDLVHGPLMSKLDGALLERLTFKAGVEGIERLGRHSGQVETLGTAEAEDGSRSIELHLEGGTGDPFKWSNGKPWELRSPASRGAGQ